MALFDLLKVIREPLRFVAPPRLALIVSLPRNELGLALAAAEGGADAVKVHLNAEHRASGTVFGPWSKERKALEPLFREMQRRDVAVGVMPGAKTMASLQEIQTLESLGVEFIDVYGHDLPAEYLDAPIKKVYALGHGETLDGVRGLSRLGIQAIEASIVAPDEYGQPLTAADLVAYRRLVEQTGMPVIVPTQRRIEPRQIAALMRAEVAAVMIGAVVTGKEPESLRRKTAEFRRAIDAHS